MKTIESIVFDLDGTLYKSIPEVDRALREYWVSEIGKKQNLNYEAAEQLFAERKKRYKSSTEVLRQMGFGTAYDIIRLAEAAYMPELRKHLLNDQQLQETLARLGKDYELAIITNSSIENTHEKLGMLGLSAGLFSAIVGIDDQGIITKPHPQMFTVLLQTLEKDGKSIMIVGDRIGVDLVPAKKFGMQTVLVTWGKPFEPNPDVDYTVETVYEVESLAKGFQGTPRVSEGL